MKPSKPVKEIIIVISAFIVLWIISFILMGPLFGNRALDINMHDTYNIMGSVWSNSVMPAFLWLLTIGYLIRSALNKFKDRTQNIILFISCACLNIMMLHYFEGDAMLTGFIHSMTRTGTIYPPLSALGNHVPKTKPAPYFGMLQILFIVQVVLILLLSIIAAITAKNWNTNKNAL